MHAGYNNQKTTHALAVIKDMRWLEGRKVKIVQGIKFHGEREPDGEARILKDYGRTLLMEMEFISGIFWANVPPRYLRTLIPKASIACGDVILKLENGTAIRPDMAIEFGEA